VTTFVTRTVHDFLRARSIESLTTGLGVFVAFVLVGLLIEVELLRQRRSVTRLAPFTAVCLPLGLTFAVIVSARFLQAV
jgi:hypothetical protein